MTLVVVGHRIAGYDRKTDALAIDHGIDPGTFGKIRKIAGVETDDPEAAYTYALDGNQLRAISALTGLEFDSDRYEYFVEPVTAPSVWV